MPESEESTIELSVVVASYETRDLLRACLLSLRTAVQGFRAEVFVVDNCSKDGSPEMVAAEFPDVRLLRNTRNEGFARANNRALVSARGRRILLLNPDTEVQAEALRTLNEVLDQNPTIGMVGPRLLRADGSLDEACKRGFPTLSSALCRFLGLDRLFPKSRLFGAYRQTFADPLGRYPVDSIVGAFMLLRREALEAVGGLDEDYFMFGEDLDFCWRMKRRSFQVYYVGDAVALHHKSASVKKAPHRMNWHFHRSMIVFHNKHLEARYPFFVNWAVYCGIMLRYALKGMAVASRACARGRKGAPRVPGAYKPR